MNQPLADAPIQAYHGCGVTRQVLVHYPNPSDAFPVIRLAEGGVTALRASALMRRIGLGNEWDDPVRHATRLRVGHRLWVMVGNRAGDCTLKTWRKGQLKAQAP